MRYKRNLHSPEKDKDKQDSLESHTRQLLKRDITCDQFRQILRENNINPNAEAINKIIRQHENGKPTKFDELFFAIHKFQADIDPTKIHFQSKHQNLYEESNGESNEINNKNLVPNTKGNGLMYLAQKKAVHSKYNYHYSNKDLFDWESSALNKYKSGEFEIKEFNEGNPRHRIVNESKVFPTEDLIYSHLKSNNHLSKKKSCNLSNNSFMGSGDFLTWKGDVKGTSSWETKEVKRKNPNEVKSEVIPEKVSRKINRMQMPSRENMLITNSLTVI